MNRAARRRQQKMAQTEIKYANMLYERQNRIDDKLIELWMVGTALAVADVFKDDDDVERIVGEIMTRLKTRLAELNNRPLFDMAKELSERTGIEFIWQ